MSLYRDKLCPYPVPTDRDLNSAWAYFTTSQPGEWNQDATMRDLFQRVYGVEAMKILDGKGMVPENISPVWVGGTFWNDPSKRIREVWGGPMDKPLEPGPDEEIIQTPFGPKIVKKESGFSKGEQAILDKLIQIEKKLYS